MSADRRNNYFILRLSAEEPLQFKWIKTADWIIDLGPEGGSRGGKIIAEGPPEKIIHVPESHTGHYLKSVLA